MQSFELKIDYRPNHGSPEHVFSAMSEYIKSFESIQKIVLKEATGDNHVAYGLQETSSGSLKAKFSVIDKSKALAKFAANLPEIIAKSIADLEDIDSEQKLDNIIKEINRAANDEEIPDLSGELKINKRALAHEIKNLTQASERLQGDDSLKISSKEGEYTQFNKTTKFSLDPENIGKGAIYTADKKEEILIRIPVFVGEQQWGFYSQARNHSFLAKISDKTWLDEFQKGAKGELSPGDRLLAKTQFEVIIEKHSQRKSFGKHTIKEVYGIIKKGSTKDED